MTLVPEEGGPLSLWRSNTEEGESVINNVSVHRRRKSHKENILQRGDTHHGNKPKLKDPFSLSPEKL